MPTDSELLLWVMLYNKAEWHRSKRELEFAGKRYPLERDNNGLPIVTDKLRPKLLAEFESVNF